MHKNRSQGFTLIELLVVIAIIGILSAVVLASLNTARSKGNDAAVQSNFSTVQTQAELYYGDNGNKYGTNTAIESNCSATDNMFNDTTIKNAVAQAETANGAPSVVCNVAANGTAYAIGSALPSAPTAKFWCTDSTGFSGQKSAALAATATSC